jgi:hypothetical protein
VTAVHCQGRVLICDVHFAQRVLNVALGCTKLPVCSYESSLLAHVKGKGKVRPRTGHEEAQNGSRGIAVLFL